MRRDIPNYSKRLYSNQKSAMKSQHYYAFHHSYTLYTETERKPAKNTVESKYFQNHFAMAISIRCESKQIRSEVYPINHSNFVVIKRTL